MVRPVPTTTGPRAAVPAPKIQVPPLPYGLVKRQRTINILTAPGPRVTHVSAAAGYGKTTMLAAHARGTPAAWVTLDHDDNNPHVLWSAILHATGIPGPAPHDEVPRDFITHLIHTIDTHPRPTHLVLVIAYLGTVETRMALLLGRSDWAAEAENRTRTRLGNVGDAELLRAFQHFHLGRVTAARAVLRRITSGETRSILVNTRIYAHLLTAQLDTRPRHHLVAALELAQPRNALRPFFDACPPRIREILVAHTGRLGKLDAFASRVLNHLPAPARGSGPPLSPRELDLLAELPSLLTLDEIAATLFVSVNTVKTHLRGLYRKLGVTSRRDAVDAARARGLL